MLIEHSLIPESLRSLTILEDDLADEYPFVFAKDAREAIEDICDGEVVYGEDCWFSGNGVSRVGDDGWEFLRIVKLAILPRALIAVPVF